MMQEKSRQYSDKELSDMLLHGNKSQREEAFTEVYSRYSQRIYSYCLKVLGNSDDAMDVFQETFLKFYSSSKDMNDFAYIFGYLIVIARNLCINHKRDEKSRYTIEDYSVSTSDVAYEQKELVDLISSAMDTLDIHHKEALVLRLYQGMSYREMAEVMNMTESYAKTLTWRAKEKLKDMLSPYLEDLSNNK